MKNYTLTTLTAALLAVSATKNEENAAYFAKNLLEAGLSKAEIKACVAEYAQTEKLDVDAPKENVNEIVAPMYQAAAKRMVAEVMAPRTAAMTLEGAAEMARDLMGDAAMAWTKEVNGKVLYRVGVKATTETRYVEDGKVIKGAGASFKAALAAVQKSMALRQAA